MDELQSSFWLTVAASSVGSTALLAIAAFLGRSQISHWLSKDLERLKSQYARELEAYKVSLIAEAEHAKSAAELKKAGALLLLGKKFDAFMNLYSRVDSVDIDVVVLAKHKEKTPEHYADAAEHIKQFRAVIESARPFIKGAQQDALDQYWGVLVDIYNAHCPPESEPLSDDLQQKLIDKALAAKNSVIELLDELSKI